ncbi:MAG: hypothetical protein U5N55_11740 [Cypionkella sp.]|nr:hypothetical protein [Cypionkella sp.]
MGKVVKKLVSGIALVAGIATGNAFLILQGASGVASSLKKRPKIGASSADRDRLNANINPRAPRTIVFGRTAMATDVRDRVYRVKARISAPFYRIGQP